MQVEPQLTVGIQVQLLLAFQFLQQRNTTYTVLGTWQMDVLRTKTVTVTVKTTPTVSVNSQTICAGNSAVLTCKRSNYIQLNSEQLHQVFP